MSSANTPRIEFNPFEDPFEPSDNATYFNPNQSSGHLSSMDSSRPGSAGGNRTKDKKKVGFTAEAAEEPKFSRKNRPSHITLPAMITVSSPSGLSPAYSPADSNFSHSRNSSGAGEALLRPSRSHLPNVSPEVTDQIRAAFAGPSTMDIPSPTMPRAPPRPALRRGDSALSAVTDMSGEDTVQHRQAREAHERGKRLERDERVSSAPASRAASPSSRLAVPRLGVNEIPLKDFGRYSDSAIEDDDENDPLQLLKGQNTADLHAAAQKLVRAHTMSAKQVFHTDGVTGLQSTVATPIEERDAFLDYVPKPDRYRGGVLGALLKLYNQESGSGSPNSPHSRSASLPRAAHIRANSSSFTTPQHSPPTSGYNTPNGSKSKPWYSSKKEYGNSSSSLAHLVGSSALGATPVSGLGEQVAERLRQQQEAEKRRPGLGKRSRSNNMLNRLSRPRLEEEIRITVHIAETIARQRYLLKLCRALMTYGAPTHRLEEYMRMSARVLEIDAQFLYIPGCMIMSFDDNTTHTTEVKIVRSAQGLDLGKLRDAHEVYKDVLHDRIGVEEATARLDEVSKKPQKFKPWILVLVSGLASASVGPFAFGARPIDLPICFLLGCILGVLQHIVAPKNENFSNVFEITATVVTSFLARAFGSISGGKYFCFSALAQSSIALILPGYMVLCASLELQSKNLVAGSVRMVYAIIYSLFLGFGITIGTVVYGLMDTNATSETSCRSEVRHDLFFIAVPIFTMCLIIINQAKWKQAPIMLVIAFAGYIVNYFVGQRFAGNTQVSNTLGALVIGVMANMYSRVGTRIETWVLDLWEDRLRPHVRAFHKRIRGKSTALRSRNAKRLEAMEAGEASDADSVFVRRTRRVGYGLAAAAMLPAIFVQVPSGLAVSGSLLSGVMAADQITGTSSNGSTVVNATTISTTGLNSIAFNVGYSVVQVAIGITVGLFLSTIVVYPLGKRRSGLFSL